MEPRQLWPKYCALQHIMTNGATTIVTCKWWLSLPKRKKYDCTRSWQRELINLGHVVLPFIISSFQLSLMQYINGQKIRVGSCRTKDILFTGNHKNKSMASFSEDKSEVKLRVQRLEEETTAGGPSTVMGQTFYSEEPEPIPEESSEKYGHSQPHSSGRSHHAPQHSSYTYSSPRPYSTEPIPRIHEPPVFDSVEPPRRQHSMDKELYSSHSGRSPMVGANFAGSNHSQPSTVSDSRHGHHSGFPVESPTPMITKIIPDVGEMLGGTELTIFGSGFHSKDKRQATRCTLSFCNVSHHTH